MGKAYTELGRELKEAQDRLAKHGYGCFEEWYTALGFKRQSVYNYIHRYTFLQQLENQKDIESFEELPAPLQYAVSNPKAESTPEKAQAKAEVLAGDIATLKEYRERIKENDLAHGEWERWVREDAKMSPGNARKFIKVFEELSGNRSTSNEIGLEALYQIATLPPEERNVPHELSTGETKKPEEMTVRELRELKRQLKETEKQAEAIPLHHRQLTSIIRLYRRHLKR